MRLSSSAATVTLAIALVTLTACAADAPEDETGTGQAASTALRREGEDCAGIVTNYGCEDGLECRRERVANYLWTCQKPAPKAGERNGPCLVRGIWADTGGYCNDGLTCRNGENGFVCVR